MHLCCGILTVYLPRPQDGGAEGPCKNLHSPSRSKRFQMIWSAIQSGFTTMLFVTLRMPLTVLASFSASVLSPSLGT